MVWIDTGAVAAEVIEFKPVRHGTVLALPIYAVRLLEFPTNTHNPVT